MIIDAHAHIFSCFNGIYKGASLHSGQFGSVINGTKEFQFLMPAFEDSSSKWEVLLRYMDINGVDKAVLMPNALYGYHNDYALEAMRACPDRFRCVGIVDITKGDEAAAELKQMHDSGNFHGLKVEVNSAFERHRDLNLLSPQITPIWEYLNENAQTLFLHPISKEDVGRVRFLVENYKNIRFIICHLGAESTLTNYTSDPTRWQTMLAIACENENVIFETSGMFCSLNEKFPFKMSNEIIKSAYKKIGSTRIIWGSDYPGTLGIATYTQLIEQIVDHCDFLRSGDKELIMAKNIDEILWN